MHDHPWCEGDHAYSRLLIQNTQLSLADVFAQDRVQKTLPIDDDVARRLRKAGLIEGRKPIYPVSAAVARVTACKANYIRTRAQDDELYANLLTDYLTRFKQATRKEISKPVASTSTQTGPTLRHEVLEALDFLNVP